MNPLGALADHRQSRFPKGLVPGLGMQNLDASYPVTLTVDEEEEGVEEDEAKEQAVKVVSSGKFLKKEGLKVLF